MHWPGCACVRPQVWPCGRCVCTLRCMEVSVHRCVFIQPSLETDSEEDTAVHTHSLMHTRPQRPPLLSAQNTPLGAVNQCGVTTVPGVGWHQRPVFPLFWAPPVPSVKPNTPQWPTRTPDSLLGPTQGASHFLSGSW